MKPLKHFSLVLTLTVSLLLILLLITTPNAHSASLVDSPASKAAVARVGQNAIVRHAASCQQADVQTAIDAAADGDIVLIPAGHCAWATPPGDATVPAITIDGKGITLQGAGVGQTVITDATGTGWNNSLIRVNAIEGHPFRITGFTFTETNLPQGIYVTGTVRDFRIDHCRFESAGAAITVIETLGNIFGVIDHCSFFNTRVLVRDTGDEAWQRPLTLGTDNAVYVEDCEFDFTYVLTAIDASHGARYVFRHNVVNNSQVQCHTCNNVGMRGTFSFEVYENTFTGNLFSAFLMRAGTGVVFNNTVSDGYPAYIYVDNRRSCENPCPAAWGMCDGTSPVDGNQDASGYPCLDQIGRSTDSGFQTTQSLEPLYEWNNLTVSGSDVDITLNPTPSMACAMAPLHIQEGRDYYNDTPRPGYTPYIYPHPLTQEVELTGSPGDEIIYLDWTVHASLPSTSTWRIDYVGTPGDEASPITGIISPTHAYTLTGLTNYQWYTVTLYAMLDNAPFLTDTVRVMPTDIFVFLPIILKGN